ncbi:MAG: recombinase family protein [Ruminococcus sp.]|nr:recombinase family protein [Ruminococcus sp.]
MKKMTVIPAVSQIRQGRIRVAAYCRVSSNKDDQEHSYETQVRYFTSLYSGSETSELVGVYADEGISGTSMDKRVEFQRLMEDCRAGKIDRIVTKSISRFARNTMDCLKSIRELKELGITIAFEKENIDTARLSDEMMITVMGGLAQEESQSISNNVRWGIQKKMASGTFGHCRVPYGYTKEKKTGDLVIDPDKAEVVRRIFDMYISGMGARKIALTLTDEGIPSPTGKAWNQKTVLNILEQEKYIGDTLWQKTYSKFMGEKFISNSGQVPQYYIEGSHPAIVSKEKFALVRDMRKASTPQKNTKVESPFRKKLICGKCGHTYALIRSKKRDYWQCGYRYDVGNPCDNIVLYDDELQTAFTALCDKLHTHNAEIIGKCNAQLTELQRLMEYGTAEGANQLKTIADLKEQKLRLATLYRKRFITTEKYDREVTEIDMQISRLSRNMEKSAENKDKSIDDMETLSGLFKGYDGTHEARKEILETAVESITISGDKLTFRLPSGLEFTERLDRNGN